MINKYEDDNMKYITIDFNERNINLIYLIIDKFKDKYLFTFNCDQKPYIGIEEKDKINNSNIFEEIDNVVSEYDENKDNYTNLRYDLKLLLDIYNNSINDNDIDVDYENICDIKHLSFYYKNDNNNYIYTVFTTFEKYALSALESGFIREIGPFGKYDYKTDNINDAIEVLSLYKENINENKKQR